MKNFLAYLLPIMIGITACEMQPQQTPSVTDVVDVTVTAISQNNPQTDAQQPIATPTANSIRPTPIQSLTPDKNSHLSLDVLSNSLFHSPDWGEFQLSGGIFYRLPPTSQESPEIYTTRLLDTIIYGDINLDGMEDAVVFLTTQNGGTGHFIEMAAVLNLNGNAHNISTLYLGDRIIINSGAIQNGLITLNLVIQRPNDGLCCPSQNETQNYHLEGGQLIQTP